MPADPENLQSVVLSKLAANCTYGLKYNYIKEPVLVGVVLVAIMKSLKYCDPVITDSTRSG